MPAKRRIAARSQFGTAGTRRSVSGRLANQRAVTPPNAAGRSTAAFHAGRARNRGCCQRKAAITRGTTSAFLAGDGGECRGKSGGGHPGKPFLRVSPFQRERGATREGERR